jgi:hypothetical protein
VRDAVFDESRRWHPNIEYWKEEPLPIPAADAMTKDEVDRVILKERGLTDNWMDYVTGPGTASTVMPQPGQPAPPAHSFDSYIAEQRQFYAPIQTT